MKKTALRTRPTAGNQKSQIVRLSTAVQQISRKLAGHTERQMWFSETTAILNYGWKIIPLLAPGDGVYDWTRRFYESGVDGQTHSKALVTRQTLDMSFSIEPVTTTPYGDLQVAYDIFVVGLKPGFKTEHVSGYIDGLSDHVDYEVNTGGAQVVLNPQYFRTLAHRRFHVGKTVQGTVQAIADSTSSITKKARIVLSKPVPLHFPGDSWDLLTFTKVMLTKQRYLIIHSSGEQASQSQSFGLLMTNSVTVSQ